MKSFRIIGVRLLQGCNPAIAKILKQNKTFFFSEGYKERMHSLLIEKNAERAIDNLRIYDVKGADDKTVAVNISAIVGKNGDGKSSIVEVIIRILNNFAWLLGFRSDQSSLLWVKDLRAVLYVESDGHIITIVCRDDIMMCYIDSIRLKLQLDEKDHQENKKRFIDICKEQQLLPFYTMVINYSLYAYNSDSLKLETKERKNWIDELFHKNDSYQTPIVLNPMREDDSIDIKREERLCRQRMMALYCSAAANRNVKQLVVNKNKKALGFAFSMARYDKFYHYLIADYYREFGADSYSWSKFDEKRNLDARLTETTDAKQNFINIVAYACKDLRFFFEDRPDICNLLAECKDKLKSSYFNDMSDCHKMLYDITTWRDHNNQLYENTDDIKSIIGNENFAWMNYAILFRLTLVVRVWNMLAEEYADAFNVSFDEALSKRKTDPRCAAMLYAIYKVISIAQTYNPWKHTIDLRDRTFALFEEGWSSCGLLNDIVGELKTMLDSAKDNYITLKFRQTINYLRHSTLDYDTTGNRDYCDYGFDHFVSFADLYKSQSNDEHSDRLSEIMPYLPPPSFDGEIIIEENGSHYPMSMFSSGELQMINTVSSLVYHLRNLDDEVAEDNKIQYKQVNIVLEEIELYFHPNYQKQYVKYMLDQIEKTQLQSIEGINILFVTHSPFILSDIIRSNMLCLEEGNDCTRFEKKTFGANIYDVLRNPFFLSDGTIGDYSQEVINRILVTLVLNREILNIPSIEEFKKKHCEMADYLDFIVSEGKFNEALLFEKYNEDTLWHLISLIDEPFIKNALKRQYFEIFPKSKALTDEVSLLEERLKELRGE